LRAATGRILRVAPDGAVSTLSNGRILAVSSAAQARGGRIYASAFVVPYVGRLDPGTGRLVPLETRALAAAGARLLSVRTAIVGRPWRAVVEVATTHPPTLAATLGGRTWRATLRRTSNSRWFGSLTLPAAGSWRLSLRAGTRTLALGRLAVRPAVDIAVPYKLALEPSGTVLVADGDRGRLVRVDPRTGAATVAARLPRPLAVTVAPDGTIYALADERLFRVGGARSTELAAFDAEGPNDIAVTPSGEIYVARYGDHVDVISAGSIRPVAHGFDRPHGITAAADGSLLVADTYAGAVRRLTPDGTITTLATGLASPIDVAIDRDGSLIVAELAAGRLSRIATNGTVTTLTTRLHQPTAVVVAPGGAMYATTNGPAAVVRVDRATGALTPVAR
jgi:streptogramin lyase